MKTYKEERPWGDFEQFCHNEKTTVKIISVKPNSKLSLQYHNHREEFWRILEGKGQVVLGEEIINTKKGASFFIPKKIKHRIITKNASLKVLEISFGNFDEKDIVRLEDQYNRK